MRHQSQLLRLAHQNTPGAAVRAVRMQRHPALLRLIRKRQHAASRMSHLAAEGGMPTGGKRGRRFSKWWSVYNNLDRRIEKLRNTLVDASLHEICAHVEILQGTPGHENIAPNLERMVSNTKSPSLQPKPWGFCGIGKPVKKNPGRRTMKGTDLDNLSL